MNMECEMCPLRRKGATSENWRRALQHFTALLSDAWPSQRRGAFLLIVPVLYKTTEKPTMFRVGSEKGDEELSNTDLQVDF